MVPHYKWMLALVAPERMVLNLRKATLLQVQSVLPCNTKSTLAALFAVIISTQEGSNISTSQLQIFCSWRQICSFSSVEKYVGKLNNASSSQEYIKKIFKYTSICVLVDQYFHFFIPGVKSWAGGRHQQVCGGVAVAEPRPGI